MKNILLALLFAASVNASCNHSAHETCTNYEFTAEETQEMERQLTVCALFEKIILLPLANKEYETLEESIAANGETYFSQCLALGFSELEIQEITEQIITSMISQALQAQEINA